MARMTKQQAEEIIEEFYGINTKTFEVERVSLTRGRALTRWNKNGPYTHQIAPGRNARAEVVVVFDLSEVKSVPQVLFGSDHEKQIAAELEAKAAKMKAAASKP